MAGNDQNMLVPPQPQPSGPGMQQPQAPDPLAEFTARSKAAGFDIETELQKGAPMPDVLNQAMKNLWQRAPTDDTAEMLEMISKQLGIPPPWGQQEEPPQQQQMPPLQMPPGMPPNNVLKQPR